MCPLFVFLLLSSAPAASLEISCGGWHICAFERGQTAMKCWGDNSGGQLGYDYNSNNEFRGDEENEMGYNLPFLYLGSGFTVDAMVLGLRHSCALSDDKAMKCFGPNYRAQLGFDHGNEVTSTGDALPFLDFGSSTSISQVTAGDEHTCALSTDVVLKCFGYNEFGQCGAGTSDPEIIGPPSQINAVDLGANFTVIDVRTFSRHVCALSRQRTLKCFGHNFDGQLGYGDTNDRGLTPESMGDGLPIVDLGSDFVVEMIAIGFWHTCALSTNKTVKCWGNNGYGQCGRAASTRVTETGDNLPVLVFATDFVPMQLALGQYHTCVLSEAATLICFGDNREGQLGIGATFEVDTRSLSTLTGIDLGSNFVPRQIGAGEAFTCAVSTNDGIKCWGDNSWGQLGLGHRVFMGSAPNQMGDNLPLINLAWPTASPTSAAPSSNPTAGPTTITAEPTLNPSTSPTFKQPTSDPTREPSTQSPTMMSNFTSVNVTVIIRTDSLSSTQILIAVANAFNSSSTPITFTVLSSLDTYGGDGFATVELLVALPSNVPQDYDVIEKTLREAMVDEYGAEIEVDITVGDDTQVKETSIVTDWDWLVTVGLCIASVCGFFAVVGVIKCTLAKRQQQDLDDDNVNQLQAAQIELAERPLPQAGASYEHEEQKEDIRPGAGGEPGEVMEDSTSDQDEGRRASVAAQPRPVTNGLAPDEFEIVDNNNDNNQPTAGHTRDA